ncbi:MAG: dihydroxy-acid dehydratase, partial [Hoeflea sp.]|nr:dihydroxy-acid dehydratase [Hoeflea sp.]
RGQMAYATGKRIVDMVREDLKPSDIMTREAFENVIVANSALGGSTNAPIHIAAIARHIGVTLSNDDWQRLGHQIPLLTNLQPAGAYLGEDFHRAGGVPAVLAELMRANLLPHPGALTVNGRSIGENCQNRESENADVIRPIANALVNEAGFLNLKGSLFDSAIMKTSVISTEFRERYLSNPNDMEAFEGNAVVFDGPEHYNRMIDDPSLAIDENSILIMRGSGPLCYPGGAEVVNMRPPSYLLTKGVTALPCIGDGRQSGTSASPSILNASPEAAAGGGLALLKNGDRIRIDLRKFRVDALVPQEEWEQRARDLAAAGGYPMPPSQTPWQKYFRELAEPFSEGMVLRGADEFQGVAQKSVPRDNH